MKLLQLWRLGGVLALGAGLMGGGAALQPAAQAQDASPWIMGLDAAKVKARESGRPIFLVFR